jgi:PAS domain S-box-containing protein
MNKTGKRPKDIHPGRGEVEKTLRKLTHELGERVKELQCLYAISELLEKPHISLEQLLQATVDIIPPAWEHPEATCARLRLGRETFTTEGFREGPWKLTADIIMRTEPRGSLEVHYIGEHSESEGSPFLEEERSLIKAIAEKIGRILWVKTVEKNMRESEERYRLLAEQVEDGVTLLQDGRFLFANRAFTKIFDMDGPEEVMGKTLDEVLESQSVEGLGEIYRSTAGEGFDTSFRKPCGTRQGREVWVEGYHGMTQYKDRPAVLSTLRDITERVLREKAIQEEADLLREENINLRTSMKERYRFGNIIGKSMPMQEVYELILKAAHSDVSVAVLGESGTGKELVARAIHSLSTRREGEFVTVNCGAIPEALLESEFFGHKKGAFTSAHADKIGYLDIANGGSLFLDEVGELSLAMQVKLLRAIDGGDYSPVGSNRSKKSDFRTICATNRELLEEVKSGAMREDFFYRIHVIPITLPPLRARIDDIPLLVEYFLRLYSQGQASPRVPGKIMDMLQGYDWPGNVRELQNVLRRFLSVGRWDFLGGVQGMGKEDESRRPLQHAVQDLEKSTILKTLDQTRWNRSRTAELLGISRRALYRRMKRLELI